MITDRESLTAATMKAHIDAPASTGSWIGKIEARARVVSEPAWQEIERLRAEINRLAALQAEPVAVPAEPIGWVYQHEETGRMSFCENDGINTPEVFQPLNPRLTLCGPAYTAPPAPTITPELREAIARQDRLHSFRKGSIFHTGEETLPCNPDDWNLIRAFLREQGVK